MTNKLEYNDFIKTVSGILGIEEHELKPETHIYDDLGIDSLGMFSLGMNLIKVYKIKLPLSEVSTIATITDLFNSLKKHEETLSQKKA